MAAYLFNSPLHGWHFMILTQFMLTVIAVRYTHDTTAFVTERFRSPFIIEGASNIFLETIKRGEYDKFTSKSSTSTVILRLYEAFGGHAQAYLKIRHHIRASKAYITNFLEDEADELNIMRVEGEEFGTVLKLDFRGFEVKTVKLVLCDSE